MGRVQANKVHKSRFSSKSSRNLHKTSAKDKSRIAKSGANVGKGARAARLQHNKMVREQKRAALLKEKRASSGSSSPPRVIVLFGLSALVNLDSVAEDLLKLLSAEETAPVSSTVSSSEYRLRATVLKAPHGDLVSCMEMAKVADLIAFVASASSLCEDSESYYIDSFGNKCLSVFRSLGLPSTAVFIRDLPSEAKRRNEFKKMCISSLTPEFPEDCKFYPADTRDELHKFMWLFREQRLSVPHWRNQRPYLVAHKVDVAIDDNKSGEGKLFLTGYVSARSLSVNQLVHISGVGDFQLAKVAILRDPFPLSARKDRNAMDSDVPEEEIIRSLEPDPEKLEELLVENVPDPLAGEQTWPTEEEMAEAERSQKQRSLRKKKLPVGTSEYQAAWIVDESDGEDMESDDDEDEDGDGMVLDEGETGPNSQEGAKDFEDDGQASLYLRDSDGETEADSMMMDADNLTREQIKEEIQKIKEAHADDEEFPDEVDTPLDVPARKRFARYRGLKSFRTSSWDPKESLPQEYARIFAFDNFKRTQKHVLAKASDMEQANNPDECVPAGTYVRLEVKEVPAGVATKLLNVVKTSPVVVCGLFHYESRMSLLHFSIKSMIPMKLLLKPKRKSTDLKAEFFVVYLSAEGLDFGGTKQMCIAAFVWLSHPSYPLIILQNRDEYHNRPTKPVGWWEDGEILGGRDEVAGGTWMACSRGGRVALLTNVLELHSHPEARSRGDLPVLFLQSMLSPEKFAQELVEEAHQYNGFNLIVADLHSKSMIYITNRPKGEAVTVQRVLPGIHVISNAKLDSPWHKANRLRRGFKELIGRRVDQELPVKEMMDKLMRDTVKAELGCLPHICSEEWEFNLSSIFVEVDTPLGRYGTRSTALLTVKTDGEVSFCEKYIEHDTWKENVVKYHYTNQHNLN